MTRTIITLVLVLPLVALACAAPSDDEFCAHILTMQMTQADANGSPSEADMKLCIEHLPELRTRFGDEWNAFARCAVRAKTERELQGCSPKLEEIAEEDRRKARDQLRSAVDAQQQMTKEIEEALEAAKAEAAAKDATGETRSSR